MGNRAPVYKTIRNCSICFQGVFPNNSARLPNNGSSFLSHPVLPCPPALLLPPVLYNPGGTLLSDPAIVLTILEYLYLRVPICRALVTTATAPLMAQLSGIVHVL